MMKMYDIGVFWVEHVANIFMLLLLIILLVAMNWERRREKKLNRADIIMMQRGIANPCISTEQGIKKRIYW